MAAVEIYDQRSVDQDDRRDKLAEDERDGKMDPAVAHVEAAMSRNSGSIPHDRLIGRDQ